MYLRRLIPHLCLARSDFCCEHYDWYRSRELSSNKERLWDNVKSKTKTAIANSMKSTIRIAITQAARRAVDGFRLGHLCKSAQ